MSPEVLKPASHLLLVDDDRLILATLSSGFSHAGYQVSLADSHDEALAFLQSGVRPDLCIVDVQMPEQDGLCLAQQLRDFYQLPFIMFSAYSDEETVRKVSLAGALGYLVKPLDIHQMVPTIEAAMARARELDALKQSGLQLQNALQAERDVNVAVGITMMQHKLPRDAAFNLLRNAARKRRLKLSVLATELIQAGATLGL
jgi:AmiR/NasT family two-component response regulator